MAEHDRQKVPSETGHEPDGTSNRGVLGFAGAVALMLLLVFGGAALLSRTYDPPGGEPTPAPRWWQLEAEADARQKIRHWEDPPGDHRDYVRQQRRRLQSWEVLDAEAGTARIPIDRAMRWLAQRRRPMGLEGVATESGGADPPGKENDRP